MDWVKNPNKVALFLWLYGPAGTGKSAIAQTIAELLEKAGFLLLLSFSRGMQLGVTIRPDWWQLSFTNLSNPYPKSVLMFLAQ
jgi:thymidylate kinase